jgi:hypothetical protein
MLSDSLKENQPQRAIATDATFSMSRTDIGSMPVSAEAPALLDASYSHDRVVLSLDGVRIELSRVHAKCIVRFVLGHLKMAGAKCLRRSREHPP